jgi:hypothetical protein
MAHSSAEQPEIAPLFPVARRFRLKEIAMQNHIKWLFILSLSSVVGAVGAVEKPAISPTPFAPASKGEMDRPLRGAPVLRSALEPPSPPDNADYYFSMRRTPQAKGWEMLLGVLLTGGFIIHRRLASDE